MEIMTGHNQFPREAPVRDYAFSAEEIAAANARHDRLYGWDHALGGYYTHAPRPESEPAPPDYRAMLLCLMPDELTAIIWEWHRRQMEGVP